MAKTLKFVFSIRLSLKFVLSIRLSFQFFFSLIALHICKGWFKKIIRMQKQKKKFVYTKWVVCRLVSARRDKSIMDGPTDQPTNGQTHPLIELRLSCKQEIEKKRNVISKIEKNNPTRPIAISCMLWANSDRLTDGRLDRLTNWQTNRQNGL